MDGEAGPALVRIGRRLAAHAGLEPPRWVLDARVKDRARALGLRDAGDYATLLESPAGAAELALLVETLRVGETRFFRHAAQIGALQRVIAPELAARRADTRRVRAWSAGCATGEEAWTLAMVLGEALPRERGWTVETLGTDLSEAALATARAGVYPARVADGVPAALRARWLEPGDAPGTVRIAAAMAGAVRFERKNLLDALQPRRIDVLLCRNVLIYFDRDSRRRTLERLVDALAPGGYLLVGYAESLRELDSLEALRVEDVVVYRRPERARASVPPPVVDRTPPPAARSAARSSGATSSLPAPAAAETAPAAAAAAATTLELAGPVAGDEADAFATRLREALASAHARLLVDLDQATYLDDALAPVLRRAAAAARASGGALALRATRPGPRRWLARHGLEELLA